MVLNNEGTVFIITGDIHALWIRDSTEQIMQYAPLLSSHSPNVRYRIAYLFQGLILKQAQYIIYDPYANSYRLQPECYNHRHQILAGNQTHGFMHTRDFELDNGAWFIKLLHTVFTHGMFDILTENIVIKCREVLFALWRREQNHNTESEYKPYIIDIKNPLRHAINISDNIGMVYTARRPSDDRVMYGYHIADNLFVHSALKQLLEINEIIWKN